MVPAEWTDGGQSRRRVAIDRAQRTLQSDMSCVAHRSNQKGPLWQRTVASQDQNHSIGTDTVMHLGTATHWGDPADP